MKVREIIRIIEADGWFLTRTTGSHRVFKHPVKGETSYGAYSPDLPGCVAVAETEEEVKILIKEAIQIYLEEL